MFTTFIFFLLVRLIIKIKKSIYVHVIRKKIVLDHYIPRVYFIFPNFVGQSRLFMHKHYIIHVK